MKPNIHPAKKFKEMIIRRFSVRLHMFVILTAVITFGLVLSRVLLMCGITSLIIRSTAVILVSYGFFFIAIRVWLFYVLPSFKKKESSTSSSSSLDAPDIGSIDLPIGKGSGVSMPSGGGGMFSGGGAGGSWNSAATAAALNDASTQAAATESVSSVSSGGSGGFSLDGFDIDSAGALVILLIFLVFAAMMGGAIYLIIEAPVILSEAAFNALLSGGMVRASKQMHSDDWTGSVFKATWIPFAVIAVVTIGSAAILTYVFPGETNISDIVRHTLLQ